MPETREEQAAALGVDPSAIANPGGQGSTAVLNAETDTEVPSPASPADASVEEEGEVVTFRGQQIDVSGFNEIRNWQFADKPGLNYAGFYSYNVWKQAVPGSGEAGVDALQMAEIDELRRACEPFFKTRRPPGH